MGSILELLKRLTDAGVEFVLVGGLAGTVHGSAMVTEDVDVCAPTSRENAERIIEAVRDLDPRFRMSPNQPPLSADADELSRLKNIYLTTDLGQLDILSEIAGVGTYEAVVREAIEVQVLGASCWVLSLDALIRAKEALGRPKDMHAAIELRAIRERTQRPGDSA